MRWLVLLLAALVAGVAPAASPARDWAVTVTPSAAGDWVIGNPKAKVRLVEYGSYTCPHCGAFAHESRAVLRDRMIRSGSVALEYHHLVRDALDLAAVVLARCGGPARFAGVHDAIFARQDEWLPRGFEFQQVNAQRIAMYPRLAQLRAYADGAGLTEIVAAQGLRPAQIDACFADATALDGVVTLTARVPAEVDSTPTFFLNGRLAPHLDWTALEPRLRAAGAR